MQKEKGLSLSLALLAGLLCLTLSASGQTYFPTTPMGQSGGGTRGLIDIPKEDVSIPEPERSRGESCCMDFVNKTGYFIDIWFDQKYQGRISPWQETYSLCLIKDAKTFTAITSGKKLQWSGKAGCGGSATLKTQ